MKGYTGCEESNHDMTGILQMNEWMCVLFSFECTSYLISLRLNEVFIKFEGNAMNEFLFVA